MRGWRNGLAVPMGILAASTAQAQPNEINSLRILAVNQATVPDVTLREAAHHATRIFSAAGITLLWTHTNPAEPYYEAAAQVRIVIVPDSRVERDRRRLGTARCGDTVAYLFYSRIGDLAAHNGADVTGLLGHVIAHEAGHMLLPCESHSARGVMRAMWDRAQFEDLAKGLLTFEPEQGDLIRTRVRSMRTGAATIDQSARGRPGRVHRVRIVVLNEAAVPQDVLRHAQIKAMQIYERIGIVLVWSDWIADTTTSPDAAIRFAVKIVSHSNPGLGDQAMGFAANGGNLAHILYTRVADFGERHQIATAAVLGHAIAHEIGHLLLTNRAHPSNGIMRASWNRASDLAILRSSSGLSFTIKEAELIHHTIETARGDNMAPASALSPQP